LSTDVTNIGYLQLLSPPARLGLQKLKKHQETARAEVMYHEQCCVFVCLLACLRLKMSLYFYAVNFGSVPLFVESTLIPGTERKATCL
jgi:hypothetical protein